MSNLSEEEIIKILNKLQDRQFVLKNLSTDEILVFGETEKLAIQSLLDLYQKEKRLAEANLKDSEEFKNNMCEHRCLLKTEYEELKIKYLKLDSDRFWGDVIAKCKIIEKIEEYKEMLKTCNKKVDIERIKAINERILAYEELLEE